MDMKKVLNLTIEVLKSNGINWDSLNGDEQLRIIMKLSEIRRELFKSTEEVLGIVKENDANDSGEERIVHTQNGDVTITTF